MTNIITRKEAVARGLRRYFTGKRCTRGHIAERYVGNADCVVCAHAQCSPEPPTLPAIHGLRGVITWANPERGFWGVRCDDGTASHVEIGGINYKQHEVVPLMVVGASVEFDLIDGVLSDNVEVVE
jgi:hypothetical protein